MATYSEPQLGGSLSSVVVGLNSQHAAMRTHERGNTEPTLKVAGLLWLCTDTTRLAAAGLPSGGGAEGLLRWDGSTWTPVADVKQKQLNAAGTVTPSANQPMGGYVHTGLGAGASAGQSVRYEQVLLVSGANALAANLSAGGNKITNLAAPTAGTDAARLQDIASVPMYWNNNRDVAGTGKPVKVRTGSGDTTNYIECGFVPRRIMLRLHGRVRKISDNSDPSLYVPSGSVLEETIWPADAIGGDPGSDYPINLHSGGSNFKVRAVAKTSGTKGFYIEFIRDPGGDNEYYNFRSQSDSAIDGSLTVLAWGGM